MSQLYMLDTDICSYLVKGVPPQLEKKFSATQIEQVCLSAVTRAELLYGLKKLASGHRMQIAVPRLLRFLRVLDWGETAAGHYAEIRHALAITGQPIGELDMMIAAHAMAVNAILVTNNTRHYARIPLPLVIENWVETRTE
jgi:tRNA(fMet)-specific endonuclease VapC